jgi:TPR repeat protein
LPVLPSTKKGSNPSNIVNAGRGEATIDGNGPVDRANQYLRTEGVPRGCAKAIPLLNRAANAGSVRARNHLASMYAVGSCVPRDPEQAYRWLNEALDADPHNQWAQQNRELMWRQMTAEERSQVRR